MAIAHANANGFRVVPNFEGVAWEDNPLPVKFDAARWVGDHWSVVFETLLRPDIALECPGCIIIEVDCEGQCRFFEVL